MKKQMIAVLLVSASAMAQAQVPSTPSFLLPSDVSGCH
jgi:hypothetical protein